MRQANWDRRRFPRWRAWGWLSGWIADDMKVSVTDISRGGVLIEHSNNVRPGTRCDLTLSLRGEKVRVKCRIARSSVYRYETWSIGEPNFIYRTGLELTDLPESSQELIDRYVNFLEVGARNYQDRGRVLA